MKRIVLLFVLGLFISCNAQEKKKATQPATTNAMPKTENEWKARLTPEQYEVLREKGTERPFTGEYWKHFEKGMYVCAACGNPLFTSDAKFDSECGWPSFDQAIKGSVNYHNDSSFGMERIEVTCAKCGGHLGHVFDDGPVQTTGKRFCTNSVSIKFIPAKK
ncbi:peptide-methionine (R)-S-oxide reductase MsrB [Flavobacterium suncheonense]|uniref:peptide-methionine (R)-S-oxide reductase n=1 Tax=Flavobacterium suncheonense GH29-5 = DSM 17707 TaxID=1121899 RepID=A0A0A2MB09_9FLAO|nr:peptide-methionine (R)-S-oxide reductase MsrB [Flavobacterium suncheonense]KGO89857.1 peptide methionine sulfoxide reductase [Flavobacterium suncheonense GH29-5 = DSM 17707]